ncbi:hypothetical protein ACWD3J_06335 [Streptomyces sp. NPDC002755]|uniref:hypothetical protein n=1 Tax=Streptomyces sp. NPDC002884 TaxID=3154544 RepID=UPI0033193F0B
MYKGDLLSAVLTRNPAVWTESSELGRELVRSSRCWPTHHLICNGMVERFLTP